MLIAGLSSGEIGVIKYSPSDNQWVQIEFRAHESSVNAISISKHHSRGKLIESDPAGNIHPPQLRFVSCSCDNQIYEWYLDNDEWKKNKGINRKLLITYSWIT